jgi:hypothetical protein
MVFRRMAARFGGAFRTARGCADTAGRANHLRLTLREGGGPLTAAHGWSMTGRFRGVKPPSGRFLQAAPERPASARKSLLRRSFRSRSTTRRAAVSHPQNDGAPWMCINRCNGVETIRRPGGTFRCTALVSAPKGRLEERRRSQRKTPTFCAASAARRDEGGRINRGPVPGGSAVNGRERVPVMETERRGMSREGRQECKTPGRRMDAVPGVAVSPVSVSAPARRCGSSGRCSARRRERGCPSRTSSIRRSGGP